MKIPIKLNQSINDRIMRLLGIFILIIAQGCAKEEYPNVEHKTNYYYLTAAQLNQSPYFTNPAFNTIKFANDKGDSLIFVKTKTDTFWQCENGSGNPNTGYDQNCYQTIHNKYTTIKGNGSFDVKHWKQGYQFINGIEININNIRLLYGDYQVGLKNYWTFKEDISLSNKSFNDLIIIYPNSYDSLVAEGYVNKDFGVFYFKDKRLNTNYLINK
jgi:hypothetical protein